MAIIMCPDESSRAIAELKVTHCMGLSDSKAAAHVPPIVGKARVGWASRQVCDFQARSLKGLVKVHADFAGFWIKLKLAYLGEGFRAGSWKEEAAKSWLFKPWLNNDDRSCTCESIEEISNLQANNASLRLGVAWIRDEALAQQRIMFNEAGLGKASVLRSSGAGAACSFRTRDLRRKCHGFYEEKKYRGVTFYSRTGNAKA